MIQPSEPLDLDIEHLVFDVPKPQPPNYGAIKQASDKRLAAEAKRKAEEAHRASEKARSTAQASRTVRTTASVVRIVPAGSCASWMAAAGISDIANAVWLINKESGCNPHAVNPSSGACGVAQELPCGKSGCVFGDGACQVAWMNRYVHERYGSWAGAVTFHRGHNWY